MTEEIKELLEKYKNKEISLEELASIAYRQGRVDALA